MDGVRGLGDHSPALLVCHRLRGFIPWLITQRPAVVHKDVLSQADILIAMKLTASQDRDAIGAWIEGQRIASPPAARRFLLRRRPRILFDAIGAGSTEPGLGGGNTRRLGLRKLM